MVGRRRRPSLVGTVARTAVVAGTAQAAAGRVHRNQQTRWSQQDAAAAAAMTAPPAAPPVAPAPAPTAPSPAQDLDAQLAQLAQLGELRDQGILTEAEFEAKKARILGL